MKQRSIWPGTKASILVRISSAAFLVNVRARIRIFSLGVSRKSLAILQVKTRVFPDPAPAKTSNGESPQLAACC